jgi:hypothetical protein
MTRSAGETTFKWFLAGVAVWIVVGLASRAVIGHNGSFRNEFFGGTLGVLLGAATWIGGSLWSLRGEESKPSN